MVDFVGKIATGCATTIVGVYALIRADDLPISAILIAGLMVFWGISVSYPEIQEIVGSMTEKKKEEI